MPRKTWQDRLRPFSEDIEHRIEQMSNTELLRLDHATRKTTNTNIWWLSFELAPIIQRRIGLEVISRQSKGKWRCGVAT